MAVFNNLLPISLPTPTPARAPSEKTPAAKVNERDLVPVKKPETRSDSKENKTEESKKASRFADVYDDELQERAEEDKAEDVIPETIAVAQVQPQETLQVETVADVEEIESGKALPLEGESLPVVTSTISQDEVPVDTPGFLPVPDIEVSTAPQTPVQTITSSPIADQTSTSDASPVAVSSTQESNVPPLPLAAVGSEDEFATSINSSTAASLDVVLADTDSIEAPLQTDTETLAVTAAQEDVDAVVAAQLQNDAPTSQSTDLAWQSDLVDRVKAWRGLAGQDSSVGVQQGSRHEFSMSGVVTSQNGQLQQFAESLRSAVNGADAAQAMAADKLASTTTTSTTAVSNSTIASTTTGANDVVNAWRADGGMTATPGATGKAPGTLGFAQTMQASSFGQSLGQAVGDSEWGESISQRIALLAGQKISSARIDLDPPELGALTVKITVNGDQASVSFQSHHAIVRDALEQSFPRLQDLLGQQGLQLADAQVSDNPSARQQQEQSGGGSNRSAAVSEQEHSESSSSHTVKVATSLVDYYA